MTAPKVTAPSTPLEANTTRIMAAAPPAEASGGAVRNSNRAGRTLGKTTRRPAPPKMADVIGLASTPSAYVETASPDPTTQTAGDEVDQAVDRSSAVTSVVPTSAAQQVAGDAPGNAAEEAQRLDHKADEASPPAIQRVDHIESREPANRLVPSGASASAPVDRMPESVRKALRLSLNNQIRAVNAAWRLVGTRQNELVSGLIEARELGFPGSEIERIRGEALGLGFTAQDFDELLRITGWPIAGR